MNANTLAGLKVEKNGNAYTFLMPIGVTYGEAYDAAHEILQDILALSKQVLDSSRREQVEDENVTS